MAGILGNALGFITTNEHHMSFDITCSFIQRHAPKNTMQVVCHLCDGLTKLHLIEIHFLERKF